MIGRLAQPGERVHPTSVMQRMLEVGVRQDLRQVAASRDSTIGEMGVTRPPGKIDPCPPGLARVMLRRNGIVQTPARRLPCTAPAQ
ncbi:hypothetical protein [Streptomyces chiangmaiensis]|uniref:Transposase n=1 Tax=Streptomyces chiangmaiensis TaxID=766497 RepID=A0ABU7FNH6_9ACTN|nr:hypothetical protein [Streptomyces chiangmaiensis]MED7824943.1 hypothetical protein [Streptomyces chiangmaiensis]